MEMFDGIINKIKKNNKKKEGGEQHEFCPRCDANLTFQKGYDNTLPYWICRGCGEMLINPELETGTDIIWLCDECEALLNVQDGFDESRDQWKCTNCGHVNDLSDSDVYESDDEYQAELGNPYKGLSDVEMLALSMYRDEAFLDEGKNIILVKHMETGKRYVKKLLTVYDKSIYLHLKDNPVRNMPRIIEIYEGKNCLIVIEEYIEGKTIADMLEDAVFSEKKAIKITMSVCEVLKELHQLEPPIIHRDIKPSNVILSSEDQVFLLDMNVAKWYDSDKIDDTRHMGTRYYAAPEQMGYGMKASSTKADVYAVGMMLNVMITGHFPKEEKAPGRIWDVIEKCICLEEDKRMSVDDLIDELEKAERE